MGAHRAMRNRSRSLGELLDGLQAQAERDPTGDADVAYTVAQFQADLGRARRQADNRARGRRRGLCR